MRSQWLLIDFVCSTVIYESRISGPIVPLQDGLWTRLDFQSAETQFYTKDTCAPFVQCLETEDRILMFDQTRIENWKWKYMQYEDESVLGADVAGVLALGPGSRLTTDQVVYLGRHGGRNVIRLIDLVAGAEGSNRFQIRSGSWSIRGSALFMIDNKTVRLDQDVEMRLTFDSSDIRLPQSLRGFFEKKGKVHENRLRVQCAYIGARIVIEGINLILLRDKADESVQCNASWRGACICSSNVVFHTESFIGVGWSILNSYDVILGRETLEFAPPGTLDFGSVVDKSPPSPRWFRFSRKDSQVWRFEPARPDSDSLEMNVMFISLSREQVQLYARHDLEYRDSIISRSMEVDGRPTVVINEDGSVCILFDGTEEVGMAVRGHRMGTVIFKNTGYRRFVLDATMDRLRLGPVRGGVMREELLIRWPAELAFTDRGSAQLAARWRDVTFRSSMLILRGKPELVEDKDGSLTIKGIAGSGDVYVDIDSRVRGVINFSRPVSRFVSVEMMSGLLEFEDITGKPQAQVEFVIDHPFLQEVTGRPVIELINIASRMQLGRLVPMDLEWVGQPVFQRQGNRLRIVPDDTSQTVYKMKSWSQMTDRTERVRLTFFAMVDGYLFPTRIDTRESSMVFDKSGMTDSPRFFSNAHVDEVVGGFNVVFEDAGVEIFDFKQGLWYGSPFVSINAAGALVVGHRADGLKYWTRLTMSSQLVWMEFRLFTISHTLSHLASKVSFEGVMDEDQEICPICADDISVGESVARIHECGHVIHGHCLYELEDQGIASKCPLCRSVMER